MFDSMWGSMASSLQLCEEYLNVADEDDVEEVVEDFNVPDRSEGLLKIAKTIDAGNLIILLSVA